ncbi:VOC family protein [Superficieibacter electus]|uniref:VOC family protein n=1 Tax=Superficieibacter electus TaxID=2022662 RepID=A0A2P5GUF5_9ENTR|nr:VOC family protein [Superficieibacter electus]POP47340.1 VOC family protein [Superficieibacter electus]POP50187.1 VOC family protein [Superficieibacter electus]
MPLVLDHLVINNHFELAPTRDLFAALGFTLTPESHHTLGSMNQLVMFRDHYLELIGLPRHSATIRQELLDSPRGIDGLVFRSHDAEKTARQLAQQGFSVQPVQHFSRAVEADGERGEARFSTVRLAPGSFAAGRVYFCQHHTPQWLWRAPWLCHANGVAGIERLTLVTEDAERERLAWQRPGPLAVGFALQILSREQWRAYAAGLPGLDDTRRSQFAAITFRGGDPQTLVSAADNAGLAYVQHPGRLLIAVPAIHTLLEFRL